MKVLAFDTALAACSAAVWADGEVLASAYERLERGHAEALMPMVEAVRTETGLAYDELDLLAVTIGPGTFTGLRIGLAAARGLSLASGLPLAGVTTLEAVAAAVDEEVHGSGPVLAVLDARLGQVYAQVFGPDLNPITDPSIVAARAAGNLVPDGQGMVVGTGARLVHAALAGAMPGLRFPPVPALPHAATVARLAARAGPAAGPPKPLYLRPPDARLPVAGSGKGP